jgi:hypothetical protein
MIWLLEGNAGFESRGEQDEHAKSFRGLRQLEASNLPGFAEKVAEAKWS